ncbi:MAG: flagellar basal body-associated FliL family protein [Plesiomonas sp.]|uniref:flagellar basal body-associated FliL family protein n=1 Tax=Plesiomonas sp. TaxID=2486279 RepID=UPI003EE5C9DA
MSQGKKSKVILLAIIALLLIALLGGGGWGYWHFVINKSVPAKPKEVATVAEVKKPIFINLDRFVISVQGEDRLHYMMLELSLMTYSNAFETQVQEFMPLVRNTVVTELSHEDFTKLTAPDAVAVLQEKLLTAIHTTMQKMGGEGAVDKVLITKLVVQ